MHERARVDMITNQADKQKIWEVMKSCFVEVNFYRIIFLYLVSSKYFE